MGRSIIPSTRETEKLGDYKSRPIFSQKKKWEGGREKERVRERNKRERERILKRCKPKPAQPIPKRGVENILPAAGQAL